VIEAVVCPLVERFVHVPEKRMNAMDEFIGRGETVPDRLGIPKGIITSRTEAFRVGIPAPEGCWFSKWTLLGIVRDRCRGRIVVARDDIDLVHFANLGDATAHPHLNVQIMAWHGDDDGLWRACGADARIHVGGGPWSGHDQADYGE
jgi:hypothetical protein